VTVGSRLRLLAALTTGVAVLAAAVLWWLPDHGSPTQTLVADAAFPAAMSALPDGGLVYGERITGRVIQVHPGGTTEEIGSVEVSADGEQRGLLGIAVRDGDVFVSYTDQAKRLQVRVLGGRKVWVGPVSADRANGGRIAFSLDGSLVIGIGNLLEPRAVSDPTAPNGKMLALDPDGPADQRPSIISSGWNNPFAFTFAPDGTLYVADNAGGEGAERLAIGNRGPKPVVLATLPPHAVPSGLAALPGDRLALCTFLEGTLRIYRVAGLRATPDARPLRTDCAIGVIVLADGTLAYADEHTIRTLEGKQEGPRSPTPSIRAPGGHRRASRTRLVTPLPRGGRIRHMVRGLASRSGKEAGACWVDGRRAGLGRGR
jgi:hypothetical protein